MPRWLNFTTAIAGLTVGVLILGGALGWVLRGALFADSVVSPLSIEQPTASGALDLRMPDVRGLSEDDARQVIVDAGFDPGIIKVAQVPSVSPAGNVVKQSPVSQTINPTSITLLLPSPAVVPDVMAKTVEDATKELVALGAEPTIKRVYQPGATQGVVVAVDPAVGSPLRTDPVLTVAGSADGLALSEVRSSGSCSTITSGTVNGAKITNGVSCNASTSPSTTFWILGRAADRLRGVVGIDDKSGTDVRARIRIVADGREVFNEVLAYGQSKNLDVELVGVLRLEVLVEKVGTTSSSGYSSSSVVLGEAVLLGSDEALAGIRK